MLLGSPPDMVRSPPLRSTSLSSPSWQAAHAKTPPLVAGIHPCWSGLQVQGTANSPISTALCGAVSQIGLLYYIIYKISSIFYSDSGSSLPVTGEVGSTGSVGIVKPPPSPPFSLTGGSVVSGGATDGFSGSAAGALGSAVSGSWGLFVLGLGFVTRRLHLVQVSDGSSPFQ